MKYCKTVLNQTISEYIRFEHEKNLLEKLLNNYSSDLRPNNTVQIKLAFNLIQIINIIEKDQIIILNAFVDHIWEDDRLIWNPADYGNITKIRISGNKLWTPDTFIYTIADRNGFLIPVLGVNLVVDYTGTVFWPNPLTQLRARCRMGILWFPFDEQLCKIVFGSWSYSVNYLNYSLIKDHPSLTSYTENNVWTLLGFKSFRQEVKYETWVENATFSEVIYKILIRRKPLFVLQNCVIPAVMLCVLTLVSFFIPFAPKMQIGMSIMLAFAVYKLRLSDDVPVQSDITPLINIYFTLCMTFSLSAMIWFSLRNILVENKVIPRWLRFLIINYICKIMYIKKYQKYYKNVSESALTQNTKNLYQNFKDEETIGISRNNSTKADSPSIEIIDQRGRKNLLIRIKHKSNKNNDFKGNKQEVMFKQNEKYSNEIFSRVKSQTINYPIKTKTKTINLNESLINNLIIENADIISMSPNLKKKLNENNIMKESKSYDVSDDLNLIKILNTFIFFNFLVYVVLLNFFCLFFLPYFFQESLSIDD